MPYDAGTAYLQVIPSLHDVEANITKQLKKAAREFSEDLEKAVPKALEKSIANAAKDAEKDFGDVADKIADEKAKGAAKVVEKTGKKSSEEIRNQVFNELKSIREANEQRAKDAFKNNERITGDFSKSLREQNALLIAALKEQQDQQINLLEYMKQAHEEELTERLEREKKAAAQEESLAKAREAAELKRVQDLAKQKAEAEAKAAEDLRKRDAANTTAGKAQTGLTNAANSILEIPARIDDDNIPGELQRLREEIKSLGGVQIGVDISAKKLGEQIAEIRAELMTIAKDVKVDINVRTDAARAATELGGVLLLLDKIDRKDVDVKIKADTKTFSARMKEVQDGLEVNMSRLQHIISLVAIFGSALVPIGASLLGLVGTLGTMALAAGSAIGVMILGFGGVGDAIKALQAQEEDKAKQDKSFLQNQNQIANALDGVASARRKLANTIRDNKAQELQADRDIKDAERDLAKAREKAAEDAKAAARKVKDAISDLADKELDAKKAREDLTQAYRDAAKEYADITSQLRHNSIDQEQAILDIAEAWDAYQALLANPRATENERKQAEITWKEKKAQYQDLQDEQKQLNEDYDDYAVNGVENSKTVVDAQRKVQAADKAVADGRQDLADAIAAQTKQQKESAESIADAERKLADERRDRAELERDNADQLADAQKSLAAAQRQVAAAYAASATAGGAALDNLNTAMAKLSPTAQRFARFIFGLKDEFYQLRAAASDGMLSGLQTAIESLLPSLPAVKDFIKRISAKIGQGFIDFANLLREPVFKDFFDYISKSAVPALDDLMKITFNLLRGFVGLFLGFTPLSEDVSGGLVDMTDKFAKWGEAVGSKKNSGFKTFIQYIRDNGPKVLDFAGNLFKLAAKLIEGLSPLGPVVLKIVDAITSFLAALPPEALTVILAAAAAIGLVMSSLSTIGALLALGPEVAIIAAVMAGVAALAVGLTVLLSKSQPVRKFLIDMWQQIQSYAMELWEAVKPIIIGLGVLIVQLWQQWFLPALKGLWVLFQDLWSILAPIVKSIGDALILVGQLLSALWKGIIQPVLQALIWLISKTVGPIIVWLYKFIVKPTLVSIGLAFQIGFKIINAVLGLLTIGLKALGKLFTWLWTDIISPWWNKNLQPTFNKLASWWDKNVVPVWDKAMKKLGDFFKRLQDAARVPIKFIVKTVLNDGMIAGYNKLAKTFNVKTIDPIPDPTGGWATGGVVDTLPGYSPGVDNHTFYSPTGGVIGLSGGEGIMRPEFTALARQWLEEGNAAARSGGKMGVARWMAGGGHDGHEHYATGGVVKLGKRRPETGDGIGSWLSSGGDWLKEKTEDLASGAKKALAAAKDFVTDPAGTFKKLYNKLVENIPGKDTLFVQTALEAPKKVLSLVVDKAKSLIGMGGGGGDSSAPLGTGGPAANSLGGSQGMMRILRAQFPGMPLYSGYRPGSITVTGNLSYHARNRAVDIPPNPTYFEWIRSHYPQSRELIYTPKGIRQVWNGKPHIYSQAVAKGHYNHVHWAYDQGGWLPDTRKMPGQTMSVFHGRQKPDAILTNEQWNTMNQLARMAAEGAAGRGDTWNFEFADSTLTPARLSSLQQRRDTLARIGRSS